MSDPCGAPMESLLNAFNGGDYGRTVEIATDMIDDSDSAQCASVHTVRGRAHLLLGSIDRAITDLEEGVRLNPDSCMTNTFLALGYRAQGRTDIPDTGLLRCLERDAGNLKARFVLATVYMSNKDFNSAAEAYSAIVELQPEDIETRVYVAYALRNASRYDEARVALDAALKINPHSRAAIEELGQWYYAQGIYKESIALYSRAIELGEANGDSDELMAAYFNSRALAWMGVGEREKAASDVALSLSIFENAGALLTKAKLALQEERVQEACRNLERASALDPYPKDRVEIRLLQSRCS